MPERCRLNALRFDPSRWPLWRPYGFRISLVDICAIVIVTLVSWLGWSASEGMVVLLPLVLGHFFLFCNVFRVRRSLEFIWSGCFLVAATWWFLWQPLSWWYLLAVQSPITLIVLLIEIRSWRYHGIGAAALNPQLDEYLGACEQHHA